MAEKKTGIKTIVATAGITGAVASLVVAGLMMSGVIVLPQDDEPTAAAPTATAQPADPTDVQPTEAEPSAEGEQTQPEATAEPEPSDGGETEDEREVVEVVLAPENGTLYLHTVQDFSPLLEAYVVDHEAGTLEYRRYTCLGTTQAAGIASLEPTSTEEQYVATWQGETPMRMTAGQTNRLQITDATLTNGGDVASVHTDMETEKFVGLCGDTGEAILSFVL